ncbi:MAG: stage II sporulation protein R [Eubacterium sp.]|nr:stage II sporulation protein R [Eubacterium sp.]
MKKIYVFVPVFLSLVLIISGFKPLVSKCENISENVFRLHILANSDSDCDQSLKLKVRNRVLRLSKSLYADCKSVDEAVEITRRNIKEIKSAAQSTLAFYDCDKEVRVLVTKEYFSTRKYGDFSLPAGVYNSLKIVIGEGRGHNWWCVMYPSVCLSGCTDDFKEELTDEEVEMLKSRKYIVRFKIVEIYERIKNIS